MNNVFYSIAIDGPSGAGKSTIAKRVARDIGFIYVDTGAIYRCVGLFALRRNVDPDNTDAVCELLKHVDISLEYDASGLQHMYLNGADVTSDIRLPEVSIYASKVSAIPAVRAFLLDMQRNMAKIHNVIMDGRDIGTVVLPDADVKIFLTASAEVRAKRRYLELLERGVETSYDTVFEEMVSRDKNDMERDTSPLLPANDSILVDTSDYGFDESVCLITGLVKDKLEI